MEEPTTLIDEEIETVWRPDVSGGVRVTNGDWPDDDGSGDDDAPVDPADDDGTGDE